MGMSNTTSNYSDNHWIIIKFPLCISEFQKEADIICDLSMGLSLEEMIHDAIVLYFTGQSIEDWLYQVETNIWSEHVPNDLYFEVKSFCTEIMVRLLMLFESYRLMKLPYNTSFVVDVDFKLAHIEIKLIYR